MTKRDELAKNWPLVVASFVGIMLGAGSLPFYLLGPMEHPLHAGFGWAASDILRSLSFLAAGTAIGMPIAGWLCDRFNLRLLALGSTTLLGLLFLTFALAGDALWQFKGLHLAIGVLTSGTGGVIYTRALGAEFNKARGLVFGIALCGNGAGSFAAPLMVDGLSRFGDWRTIYVVVALVIWIAALPTIFFGMKRRSEHRNTTAEPPLGRDAGLTRRQAIRDPRFYLILISLVLFGLFVGSLVVNMMPILMERGISRSVAAQIASSIGLAVIVGRLSIGWLLDWARPSFVGAGACALAAAGATIFVSAGTQGSLFGAASLGLLIGAEIDLLSFMTLRYFGVRHYGEIFGLLYASYAASGIIGPMLCAAIIGWGGAASIFIGAAFAFSIAAVSFLALIPFERAPNAA